MKKYIGSIQSWKYGTIFSTEWVKGASNSNLDNERFPTSHFVGNGSGMSFFDLLDQPLPTKNTLMFRASDVDVVLLTGWMKLRLPVLPSL